MKEHEINHANALRILFRIKKRIGRAGHSDLVWTEGMLQKLQANEKYKPDGAECKMLLAVAARVGA